MGSLANTRKTKIVCTMGPASSDEQIMTRMIEAGMDVARLNFSHGDHASHADTVLKLRRASKKLNREIGILQDLAGPKIRLGEVAGGPLELKPEQEVTLVEGDKAPAGELPVNYPYLLQDVKEFDRILLADGLVELKVTRILESSISCKVVVGGAISSHKGVNLPTSSLRIPAFTEKDQKDLEMGLKAGVDFVAMSFVRHENDLEPVREMINHAKHRPLLIAKIEKPEAVERIQEILAVVDGVMVARGDLGVEMPLAKVPIIQKSLIRQARRAGKVVITATQMLRSMIDNPRPTRAEANDVANAILDGTDAVMLSEESAVGKYPVRAVQVLEDVAKATEPSLDAQPLLKEPFSKLLPLSEAAISRAACWLAEDIQPAAIVASTTSGNTARLIARFRCRFPLVGMTPSQATCRQLNLSWGVIPSLIPHYEDTDEMFAMAKTWVAAKGLAGPGDRLIITAGVPAGVPGTTNLVKVIDMDKAGDD
jgi:pyruvate kinase